MKSITLLFACFVPAIFTAYADITPITASDFAPGAQVITFETGSTELPTVPGVTFLQDGPSDTMPWYGSSATLSDGFFGTQGWANQVSSTYSDLGIQFAAPVQAVGGYVGWTPNFTMENPATVEIELFNSSLVSLGTAEVTLTPAFNSPIFFGFTASEPITRFRMTGNNAGFFMVDNFTFGSVVPEPAPFNLALLGAGMVWAVSNFARRRSNAAATIHKTKSVRP